MALVISRSLWRKLLVMSVAVVSFVLWYETSTFDFLVVPRAGAVDPAPATAGTPHPFTATAYCKGTTTASGVGVRTGIAASDPAILPVGSVVNITTDETTHDGVYTIMDTGPKIQGRLVDIYMWSCYEALAFGRQPIELTVLRLGWNPANSVPSLIDRLFRRREANRATRPPVPPTADVPTIADEAGDANAGVDPTSTDGNDSTNAPRSPEEAPPPAVPQAEQPNSPSPTVATASAP